jgi:hypothetical protein
MSRVCPQKFLIAEFSNVFTSICIRHFFPKEPNMNRRYSIFAGSAVAALALALSAAAQQIGVAPAAAPAAPQPPNASNAAPVQPPADLAPARPSATAAAAPLPWTQPPDGQISGGSLTLSAGGRGRAMIAGPGAGMFSYAPDGVFGFHAEHDVHDPDMEKINRSVHELEQQSHELMRKYVDTDDAPLREKAKAQLREMLSKQFDLQNQRRSLELTRIEERLGKLRDQLKRRTDARDQIVDQRLLQLVSEAEGLGWAAPGNGSPLDAAGRFFPGPFKVTQPAPAVAR